jgi:hypothetical protein
MVANPGLLNKKMSDIDEKKIENGAAAGAVKLKAGGETVKIPLLTRTNLHVWRPLMEAQLVREGLEWVYAKTTPSGDVSPDKVQRAKQLLLVTISNEVQNSAQLTEKMDGLHDFDARKRWAFYLKHCANAGGNQRMAILTKFDSLRSEMKANPAPSRMERYLDTLTELYLSYLDAGGSMTKQTLATHIINGLAGKYVMTTAAYEDLSEPDVTELLQKLRNRALNMMTMQVGVKNNSFSYLPMPSQQATSPRTRAAAKRLSTGNANGQVTGGRTALNWESSSSNDDLVLTA